MDGKEAIIAKIISDAEKKAQENVHNAEQYAFTVKEQAEKWGKAYAEEREKVLQKESAEIVARRKLVAGLDVRKILLKSKQNVLDEIYVRAEEKLCKLPKKSYLSLVLAKIGEYADEGDGVVLSCDGVLAEKDIMDSDVAKSKRLHVEKRQGKFVGGVILVGKTCDKDLTFKAMISAEKEQNASAIAKRIFG